MKLNKKDEANGGGGQRLNIGGKIIPIVAYKNLHSMQIVSLNSLSLLNGIRSIFLFNDDNRLSNVCFIITSKPQKANVGKTLKNVYILRLYLHLTEGSCCSTLLPPPIFLCKKTVIILEKLPIQTSFSDSTNLIFLKTLSLSGNILCLISSTSIVDFSSGARKVI